MDNFSSPIFITGLPRSGTSLVAGFISHCGVWSGRTVPCSGKEAPGGFYEHTVLRERVVKGILRRLGCDPLGVRELPPVDISFEDFGLRAIVSEAIRRDGYLGDIPWLYKDAKLCLMWRAFDKAFPDARWVVVRRDPEGIICSCLNTYFMRQSSDDREFYERYVREYMERIEQLKAHVGFWREVWTNDLVKGDKSIVGDLGLKVTDDANSFIMPEYWHGNSYEKNAGSKIHSGGIQNGEHVS